MKLRKLLAGIISAVMVFGTAAMPVFADENTNAAKIGETEYATLKEAVAAAQNGETVTLLSDASGDGIDSNGNFYVKGGEIYVSGPENDGNGALDYSGDAQITGGTIVAAGMACATGDWLFTSFSGTTRTMLQGKISVCRWAM